MTDDHESSACPDRRTELRHPQCARAEDRIRATPATPTPPRHIALRTTATLLVTICDGSTFPTAAHLAF